MCVYEKLKASVQQGDKGVETFLPACRKKTEGHSVTVEELACNISADSEQNLYTNFLVHKGEIKINAVQMYHYSPHFISTMVVAFAVLPRPLEAIQR